MADNKFTAGSFCRKRVIEIYISYYESCLLFIPRIFGSSPFSGGLKNFYIGVLLSGYTYISEQTS